jgi:hypothetical protein
MKTHANDESWKFWEQHWNIMASLTRKRSLHHPTATT